ncbi:hypothetical protein HR060_13900 [Catenovulum sp. SM1970]|uniref:hypothetical protein n=1 Tax=Marinifaba aquimaris TaxID=2741323 RepID=UPI001572C1C2|nr:hypothetical protein [Marinifaba aquimaris]NTS77947.1 hypothetical protein [Marinifaba aquimaris]
MPELLFLLLPVAALYGYVMGRNSFRQQQLKQHEKINQNFLSGLNLFLNNQRDKAIEVLIENLEVDNETFTTHIALGKLFRAKGENDRAIKIHQFLAKQDTLSPKQRKTAILQLAYDFVESALFDRAEALLLPLTEDEEFSYETRIVLCRIYQTYRDWQKAYDIISELTCQEGDDLNNIRAYLLCELAEKAENKEIAESLLIKALNYDNSCARAYLELIEIKLSTEQLDKAQAYASSLAQYCQGYVPLLIKKVSIIFPELDARLAFLKSIKNTQTSSVVAAQIAQIQSEMGDTRTSRKTLISELEKNATIQGFANLLAHDAEQIESSEAKQKMQNLKQMVITKITQLPDYECGNCGYQGSYLFWQCPRCKQWGSVEPIKGLTGD